VSSRWREFRGVHPPKKNDAVDPATCPFCRRPVIWARLHVDARRGERSDVSYAVERCEPGTGDIALTMGLFLDGARPRAEFVSNGTSYRSHRPHCPTFPREQAFTAATRPRKQRPDDGGRR
jgi:hypothetical protein